MSRRTPLDSQTTKLNIVIRKNKEISKSAIKNWCSDVFKEYAFIEHKDDIDPKTKTNEGVHYHIVGNAKQRVRLVTRLNDIVRQFSLGDSNGIEIEAYRSFPASIQYLIHLNQKEKTQHDKSEIVSNISKEELLGYLQADTGELITFDRLYTSIMNAVNIIEIIKDLGIKSYKEYRNVIWDMWRTIRDIENVEVHTDYVK